MSLRWLLLLFFFASLAFVSAYRLPMINFHEQLRNLQKSFPSYQFPVEARAPRKVFYVGGLDGINEDR
ncbi:unnamed protein product [Caenorhabditis auriculariae]|uniref:Uncharacterized protein n=1 Tax=Caenorhabditis auriculariae TaxID=2777116 RepID=A0A8S1HFR5_9PELO|nr:unnamed protein product [Caenorhabditis auriculariae]